MKRAFCICLSICTLLLCVACSRAVTLCADPPIPDQPETKACAAAATRTVEAPLDTNGLAALLRTAAEPRACSAGSSLRMAALAGGLLCWAQQNPASKSEEELSAAIRRAELSDDELHRCFASLRLLEDAALRMEEEQLQALLRDAGCEAEPAVPDRDELCAFLDSLMACMTQEIFKNSGNRVNISWNNHCRPGKRVL